jgi:hypothetical protein
MLFLILYDDIFNYNCCKFFNVNILSINKSLSLFIIKMFMWIFNDSKVDECLSNMRDNTKYKSYIYYIY